MKRVIFALLLLMPLAAWAGEARDMAKDPVVEKRMIGLAEQLRCLVCQNESLASSHAELAEDLRREVRELIAAGKTDDEIRTYLVDRYGDFVLYEPPVTSYTFLLWFGPLLMLLGALGTLAYQLRKRRQAVAEPQLSPEAQRRAQALLEEDKR